MRTFLAIDLPEDASETVRAVQRRLGRETDLALSVPKECHLTLKFLGDITSRQVDDFTAALRAIRAAPFEIDLMSLGAFPDPRRPRVIWLGISESRALDELARAVDEATGSVVLDKPFRAHITLARVRGPAKRASPELFDIPIRACRFTVREFVLYQSTLTAGGAAHTPLRRFSLDS
jgi:2'-5' RNA ligase